jgi:5'-nucleotidase (lipoprotein e(P4) family)
MIDETSLQTVFDRLQAVLVTAITLLIAGCSSEQVKPGTHESLNATLWAHTAAEYAASATQAYYIAAANLDPALADSQWTAALEQRGNYSKLPPAVLMDIDQTVLDNSVYNSRIVMQYGEYSQDTFTEWCEEAAATAIPGAKYFVDHAIERGVTIIYYSRRLEALRDCTTRNLEALGFPLPDQKYLLLNNQQPETRKAHLRSEISLQFRILLLVGDDLDDFVAGSKTYAAARRVLSDQHADRWGREWIILPNPMYGSWESSLYEFDYKLPVDTLQELKSRHLEQ